jgi:hypothetical protein
LEGLASFFVSFFMFWGLNYEENKHNQNRVAEGFRHIGNKNHRRRVSHRRHRAFDFLLSHLQGLRLSPASLRKATGIFDRNNK